MTNQSPDKREQAALPDLPGHAPGLVSFSRSRLVKGKKPLGDLAGREGQLAPAWSTMSAYRAILDDSAKSLFLRNKTPAGFVYLFVREQVLLQSTRSSNRSVLVHPDSFVGCFKNIAEVIVYSFNVAALQKPEPLPGGIFAKIFVLLETILGPLQAALLALAIRRRFMR